MGKGSGILGSVKSKDLQIVKKGGAPAASVASAAPYEDIPVSSIRGVIAKRLLESKTVRFIYC